MGLGRYLVIGAFAFGALVDPLSGQTFSRTDPELMQELSDSIRVYERRLIVARLRERNNFLDLISNPNIIASSIYDDALSTHQFINSHISYRLRSLDRAKRFLSNDPYFTLDQERAAQLFLSTSSYASESLFSNMFFSTETMEQITRQSEEWEFNADILNPAR